MEVSTRLLYDAAACCTIISTIITVVSFIINHFFTSTMNNDTRQKTDILNQIKNLLSHKMIYKVFAFVTIIGAVVTIYAYLKADSLVFKVKDVSFKMIRVKGGTFTMGASEDDDEAIKYERPEHTVKLSTYYIGVTEVTQELWDAVMIKNKKDKMDPSIFKGPKRPVENVSWYDCKEFIEELNAVTGYKFRLPSEAQWEFAARGGNNKREFKYSGSNTLGEVAWYKENSGDETQDVAYKHDPNELGLYDMSGNVWEWCSDPHWYYSRSKQTNPEGPKSNNRKRVARGGSWYSPAECCRVTYRYGFSSDFKGKGLGLRLVLSE